MRPTWKAVVIGSFVTLLAYMAATVWLRHLPKVEGKGQTDWSARQFAQGEAGPDLLDRQSKALAGPNAIDCGTVPVHGDPKAATACALAAQKEGKPFFVRYDLMGFDSAVAVTIVRTPIGTVGALNYDGDPAGGGGRAHEVIYPKRCPEPVHLWVNPSGRINCFQQKTSPPKDAMSPNAEPY